LHGLCPATNLEARLAKVKRALERIPGGSGFLHEYSPSTHASEYRVPIYLFHAADDSVISLPTCWRSRRRRPRRA